jgi:hypothetical protein
MVAGMSINNIPIAIIGVILGRLRDNLNSKIVVVVLHKSGYSAQDVDETRAVAGFDWAFYYDHTTREPPRV